MNSAYSQANIFSNFINQVKEYAIFVMDVNGVVSSWNIGAQRIKGYKEEEVIGQFYGMLFTEEDQQKGKPLEEIEITKKHGIYEAEAWRRKKDGSLFWAGVTLTAIYNEQKKLIGFTKVTKDLTLAKLHEEALYQKNEALEKANKDLDTFIYTASHDLKAPILNIEGLVARLSRLFEKKSIYDTDLENITSHIKTAIVRFKNTIEDLTTLSRLQRTLAEENNREKVDVQAIFEEVMADVSFLFEHSPCEVHTDFKVRVVSFSRKNFRSILYNLISNAFKYRSAHGHCHIRLQTLQENDRIVLVVRDNGLGMNKRNKEQLFSMFKRFHTHVEGSGIGCTL
jgi:PAS domain S-box-containing protein